MRIAWSFPLTKTASQGDRMNRKQFLDRAARLGFCSSVALALRGEASASAEASQASELDALRAERDFIVNWLTDLLEAIEARLDDGTKRLLMAGCGKGCYDRHQFKRDLAAKGKGSLDRLTEAYRSSFEVWRQGDLFHIRYGEISKGCFCPVAKAIPPRPDDIHCECTRATHQAIFEAALGRPFEVEIVESVRRGGRTCHFTVRLD